MTMCDVLISVYIHLNPETFFARAFLLTWQDGLDGHSRGAYIVDRVT